MPIGSTSEHFGYWLEHWRTSSILARVGPEALTTLAAYLTGLTLAAVGLVWSLKRQGLLRLRLNVRSLMVAVAIIAVAMGGWNPAQETWDRWLRFRRLAEEFKYQESKITTREKLLDWGYTNDDVDERLRRDVKQRQIYGELKVAFNKAMWTPWIEMIPTKKYEELHQLD